MEPKKLYYVIATAAFLSGVGAKSMAEYVPGIDQALMSSALAGVNETRTHSFKLNSIPANLLTIIDNYLAGTECPKVNARYGEGVCTGAMMPFTIRMSRKPNGTTSVDGLVRNIPVFATKRPPAEPGQPEVP
jgi:hypothetical protein